MGKWKIAGAEVIGRKHVKVGLPCQDKVSSLREGKTSVIALSDGAGSRTLSQVGADVSVKVTCKVLSEMFDDLFKLSNSGVASVVLSNVLKSLHIESEHRSVNVKELSSTLLFVAISRGRYISGHIGDGVIAKIDDDILSVYSQPDNGEYSNETYFVTSPEVLSRFRVKKGFVKDESGFILMSDGSAESLYDKRNNLISPVSSQMIKWLDTNTEEVVTDALKNNIEQFISKKTYDDCSVIMMRKAKVKEHPLIRSARHLLREIRVLFYDSNPDDSKN